MLLSLSLTALAVRDKTGRHRVPCVDRVSSATRAGSARHNAIGIPFVAWDASRVYRVPVVLVTSPSVQFSMDSPQAFYDRLFNEQGFNLGHGPGCVTDYFRDQSNGLFNVQFDVVGPVQTTRQFSDNMKTAIIKEAIQLADSQLDFSAYTWENDRVAKTVVLVFAGYGGNDAPEDMEDQAIWPSTSDYVGLMLDGVSIGGYSQSSELWSDDTSCGIGTICHEFSHVLGLPDFYPTSGDEYSVLDEWDLMDGGNFSDAGWCPPNLSAHERESLGWYSPEDLTAAVAVQSMPSYDSSRRAYRIVNDASPSEYYLLENRQWERWDQMLPGHGLLITHVDFDSYVWEGNRVNNSPSHHRLEYFNADGMDVNAYIDYYGDNGARYSAEGRNLRLQHTAYPYVDADGVSHDALTDTSSPAATLFNRNAQGVQFMGKPITNIRETDGLISFDFMGGATDAITHHPSPNIQSPSPIIHDLQGRQVSGSLKPGLYIKNGKKVIIY